LSPSRKSAPSAVVGLDIGTDSIKVAEAKIARDGITITGVGIAKTPPGVVENEVIVDPLGLANAIKALLAESGIKTKRCVSSVSGASQVVVRVISVPKMTRDELAETMKWEVERHVPFSPQEVVMDFQPLDKPGADPDATEMEVLLAVAQQQLIDSHVETLFAAGLQPMAIDIEPLAACRSLIELSQNGAMNETVAIVNIGSTRTDLGVFENGLLTFPSPPLGVAGVHLTREIAEALGQTLDQAEITKWELAAVDIDAFGATAADTGAAPPPSAPPSEPTAFDTAFGPGPSAFDLDEPIGGTDQVQGPAPSSDFATPVEGPAFDLSMGPSFDVGGEPSASGETDEPGKPSFDLDAQDTEPGSVAPAFDLGGDLTEDQTPAAPMFDLSDDEPQPQPEPEQVAEPSFDLSDAGKEQDHGRQVEIGDVGTGSAGAAAPKDDDSAAAQVFAAISGVLVDLANELRMSLEYYTTRYGKTPERVFLCGGTAKIPRLDEFLSRELGLPVVVADPISNVRVTAPGVSAQYLKEISPLLPVCIGLAIRDML